MQATSGYGRISESAGWPLGDGREFGWIPVECLKNGQNTVPGSSLGMIEAMSRFCEFECLKASH